MGAKQMTALRRDTIDEEDYSMEDYGWDDHQLGVRLGDNPFAINNWKYYEWEKGWLLADESITGHIGDAEP